MPLIYSWNFTSIMSSRMLHNVNSPLCLILQVNAIQKQLKLCVNNQHLSKKG